ncbi:MAG: terminase family protein [Campylobacterales bacterium]|nr:terminase family protein [Campylobacterales bacterium]
MSELASRYFMPYQKRWIADQSKIKIWEKSRRIGATYVQAYEDVKDCARGAVPAVWFSSADETAAKEYILYCEKWAKVLNIAANSLGKVIIEDDKDIKALSIEFANGRRINALSSNPKQFRSKGGKVILDEYAFHDNPEALWKAAKPVITWGFPLRILSTYNGKNNRYFRFVEDVKKGNLKWSLHTTDIYRAVEEGLVDKIYDRKTTAEERAAWIEEERANCGDEYTWLQEYCCTPVDETNAFLSYEMLANVEDPNTLMPLDSVIGDLYLGVDIGRKKDLTVMWVVEKLGRVKYTRVVIVMERATFKAQREQLFALLAHPKLRRACIDATGLGMQLAEEAQEAFGKYKVEAVTITAKVKEDIAYGLHTSIEDREFFIPADRAVREDFHSVRKITTAAGNIRFDVAKTETDGHGDRFIAAALADNASKDTYSELIITSSGKRSSQNLTRGY